jgi:hypothetical protein
MVGGFRRSYALKEADHGETYVIPVRNSLRLEE